MFNCGYWAENHRHIYREAFPNGEIINVYGSNEGTSGLPGTAGRFLLNYRPGISSPLCRWGEANRPWGRRRRTGAKVLARRDDDGRSVEFFSRADDVVVPLQLRPPVFRLCGRGARILSPGGYEAVTEDEVVAVVRAAGFRGARYFLGPARRGYVLHLGDGSINAAALDGHLRRLNARSTIGAGDAA